MTRIATIAAAAAAALLAGCAAGRVPVADNGLTPYPLQRELKAGDIVHLPTGLIMDFDQMMDMVSAAKVVYIGELHTNFQAHEVQRRIAEELERRFPGKVAIGMEMFREPEQPVLDRWTKGELSELEFLKKSRWYENWGADFGNYRGVLTLARDHKLDVVALNPSREVQKRFAEAGAGPLPPDLAARVPETDFSDPIQRALLQAIFAGHDMAPRAPARPDDDPMAEAQAARQRTGARERMFESFYRTQVLWEESMASRIVDYLRSPAGEGKRMIVLAGGFHVRHGLGVPRKALRRAAWPYVIVLPTELEIPEQYRAELTMDVNPPEIPLISGDFAWIVGYEDLKANKVRLGVMLGRSDDAVAIEKVVPGSPADLVGIRSGDVFVSLDDFPVREAGDVILVINGKKPGDTVRVKLRRDGAEVSFEPVLTLAPDAAGLHHPRP